MVICSRLCYEDPLHPLPTHETINQVEVYRVRTTQFGREELWGRGLDYLSFYVSAAWKLWLLLSPDDKIVAKTDPPMISVLAATMTKIRGAKLINWCQDLFPEVAAALKVPGMSGPIVSMLKTTRNWSLKQASCNVAIGERMALRLAEEGVAESQISIIHNWSNGDEIRPILHSENSLRKRWGLDNRFVVGYSGNLGRAHEIETIIQVATVLKDHQNLCFLFIGSGLKFTHLEQRTRDQKLTNFLFKPYQPRKQLRESLGVPDLHLVTLPPAMEGLIVPSKFYGIAAAGRPTIFIGDRQGEIAKIIHQAACGFSGEIGNGKEITTMIKQCIDDPELVNRLGNNARKLFEEKFSMNVALQSWSDLLLGPQAEPFL